MSQLNILAAINNIFFTGGIMPEIQPPSNFVYSAATNTLQWDSVPNASAYQIMIQPGPIGDWSELYLGPNNFCPFDGPSGRYNVRGKTKEDETWGLYGPEESILKQ
jgi:hypothetical protein